LNRSFVGSGMTLGFALAAVVVIASGLLIHRNIQLIARNEAQVVHTHRVLHAMDGIRIALSAAESSQRGFIITTNREYLQPFRDALPEIDARLKEIAELTIDDPSRSRQFEALRRLVAKRLTSLETGIGVVENDGRDAARDFVLRGEGFAQMAAVRDVLTAMTAEEERLLLLRNEDSRVNHRSTSRTALLAAIVGLAMVLVAYFLSMREVINRKKMTDILEERVRERTAELATANTLLQHSNRELEQFASVASHDLQEPLRKIEAFGDRLKMQRETLNEQAVDYLDRILKSASRMRTLINDLLSFSRVATRALPFKPVDLGQIANEVVGDLEGRLQHVEGQVELDTLPTIEADPTQMRQLLQNLIGNALKFHRPEVSPVVKVKAERQTAEGQPERLVLTVADNGIGFEEQYLDRIFEVFQRLHGRTEFEGTGIGLAICRKIVERHHGTITARSKPGEGSTFIVTLPIEQLEKEDPWQAANPSSS
jgi:signal transduction histidine kinase